MTTVVAANHVGQIGHIPDTQHIIDYPTRPTCNCICDCTRRPGRRIFCHGGCNRLVGPGCCYLGLSADGTPRCHMCGYGNEEPDPEPGEELAFSIDKVTGEAGPIPAHPEFFGSSSSARYLAEDINPQYGIFYACEGPVCRFCRSDRRAESWSTISAPCSECGGIDCGNLVCNCYARALRSHFYSSPHPEQQRTA